LKKLKRISIIIPALNEEKSIRNTIKKIPIKRLNKLGYDVEIIVVDGKSTDRTCEIALEEGAKVIIEPRRGYGRAYLTGFKYATGDIIVTSDADDTYPLEQIPKFVMILEKKNLDFITTNRFWKYDKGAWSPINYIGNKLLTTIMNFLFLMNLKDSQSGMWVFKRSILKKLNLRECGMSFSTEIKVNAKMAGLKMIEVSIYYRRRLRWTRSKLNWIKDGLEIMRFLIIRRLLTLI